jgi:hypothetical protein
MDEIRQSDSVEGGVRLRMGNAEVQTGREQGWLLDDRQRRRPRYFDGLLLKAADLTRDQDYFLARQGDFERFGGAGVIDGLSVSHIEGSNQIAIEPGCGVTTSGRQLVLGEPLAIDLSDVATVQRFDATFGIEVRPDTPMRNRSGLFIVTLRPVEFTANPAASYPTALQGERTLNDGDIIEAVAVTLIPFEEVASPDAATTGRARLAREIFVRGAPTAPTPDGLSLAVLALERGQVVWVDRYLVRRDKTVEQGVGFSRARQEAFLQQYTEQLRALWPKPAVAPVRPLVASEHFQALPSFGPLPVESVQVRDGVLLQWFLPAQFVLELTIVPEDELAALAEEALSLPPFDLTEQAEVLDDMQVLVLIPVARARFANLVSDLHGKLSRTPSRRVTRAMTRLQPIALLTELRRQYQRPPSLSTPADLEPWDAVLEELRAAQGDLYFMRRRRLTQVPFAASRFQALPPDSPEPTETLSSVVRERLINAGELDPAEQSPRTTRPLDFMLRVSSNEVARAAGALLSMPAFESVRSDAGVTVDTSLLVNGAIEELAHRTRVRLDDLIVSDRARASVVTLGDDIIAPPGSAPLRVRALRLEDVSRTRERYRDPKRGTGVALLTRLREELSSDAARRVIARSLRVPELDAAAMVLAEGDERATFASTLSSHALAGDVNAIRDLVDARYARVQGGVGDSPYQPIPGFPGSDVAINFGEGKLYYLLHGVANESRRLEISNVLSKPRYGVQYIVSTLLAHLLYAAFQLVMKDANDVRQVLEKLHAWQPPEPFEPLEARSDGSEINNDDAAAILTAYDRLTQLDDAFLASLPTLLAPLGTDLDVFHTMGFVVKARPAGTLFLQKLKGIADVEQQRTFMTSIRNAAGAGDLQKIRDSL